ncbi:early nodulin-like protein 9 [Malania oleifera]|uniref:early nodulin-like protein 9 n=1 Tax=Malania oleifera TaxID=397392 RepID=UPI0025AE39D8|nr:early nodulin-like protein 9 [Malania oleifera]
MHFLSMANTALRSDHFNKAMHILGLYLLLLIGRGSAREFKVGDSNWTVPTNPNALSYNEWAEKNRFQTGDSIVFDYPAGNDSVLLVDKDPFTNCNTATFHEKHTDGHTMFTFNHSGPFYFISGNEENCMKNEKLEVIVLADRSNDSSNSNQTGTVSPPPAAPAGLTPSPAPAGKESPTPPAGTVQINPTPAPESPPPPPSGASSIFMSFIVSSFGAFVGSSLLLVF